MGAVAGIAVIAGATAVAPDPRAARERDVLGEADSRPEAVAVPAEQDPAPSEASRAPVLAAEPKPRPEETTSVSPPRGARRRPASAPPSAPPDASASLSEDTRLLRAASGALRVGDAKAALGHLQRHAAAFAGSPQADLRVALEVEALCRLGRVDGARRSARLLLAERPGTPVAERIARTCAAPR
jgi:hypothetical protein